MKKKNFRELVSLQRDDQNSDHDRKILMQLVNEDPSLQQEAAELGRSLDLLKNAAYDKIEVSDDFNGRVLRRHRIETKRRTFQALFPALIGAVTAAVGLIAMIQVASAPLGPSEAKFKDQKAELQTTDYPVIPGLTE